MGKKRHHKNMNKVIERTVELLDDTKRNEFFEVLCRKTQDELLEYLRVTYHMERHPGVLLHRGTVPVMVTAHLDTVHKEQCRNIIYMDNKITSPQGIGGDDRCGIYMALKILEKLDVWVLFCKDEEIGSIGAEDFIQCDGAKAIAKDVPFNYIIELDRMNKDDAVFYDLENDDFEDFILKDHWKLNFGSWSDICTLAPFFGVAAVNLSCGYYNPHTTKEYVALDEMETNIRETIKLIERTTANDKFEWKEKIKSKYGVAQYYDYDTSYNVLRKRGYESQAMVLDVAIDSAMADAFNDGIEWLTSYGYSTTDCWLKLCQDYPWLSLDMVEESYVN